MRKILTILALALTFTAAAQPRNDRQRDPRKVTKANYELASRFSQKETKCSNRNLAFSSRVTNWLNSLRKVHSRSILFRMVLLLFLIMLLKEANI